MSIIEISSTNCSQFKNLDIVAFSLSHAGAMGEGGGINLLTSNGKLYHSNIVHSIKLEELFTICQPLKECYFSPIYIKVPAGWSSFYMGGGNFLVVKDLYKDVLSGISPCSLYQKWADIIRNYSRVMDVKY